MSFAISKDIRPFQQVIVTENLQLPVISLDDIQVLPAGSLNYNPNDGNIYVSNEESWEVVGGSGVFTKLTILSALVSNLTAINEVDTSQFVSISASVSNLTAVNEVNTNISFFFFFF